MKNYYIILNCKTLKIYIKIIQIEMLTDEKNHNLTLVKKHLSLIQHFKPYGNLCQSSL